MDQWPRNLNLCASHLPSALLESLPLGLPFGYQEETWIGLPFTKIHVGFLIYIFVNSFISYQWKTDQSLAQTNLCQWVTIVLLNPERISPSNFSPNPSFQIRIRPEDRDHQYIPIDGPKAVRLAISSLGESNETYGSSPKKNAHIDTNMLHTIGKFGDKPVCLICSNETGKTKERHFLGEGFVALFI